MSYLSQFSLSLQGNNSPNSDITFWELMEKKYLSQNICNSPFYQRSKTKHESSFVIESVSNRVLPEKWNRRRWVSSISAVAEKMVFCYQNCSDLLWEKIVLVIEKKFWNSRLKAENLQKFWDHLNNLFKQWKVRTIFGNRMLF